MFFEANTTLRYTYTKETTRTNTELARARYINDSLVKYARGNVTEHTTRAAALNANVASSKKSLNDKREEFQVLSRRNDVVTRLDKEVSFMVQNVLVSECLYISLTRKSCFGIALLPMWP